MKSLTTLLSILISISAFSQTDLEVLEQSPRHHEWVELESNGKTLHNFIVYPEVSDKAKVFIVIHENRGLNDWARRFADELAEKGFIAVAPDLLSNSSEGISKTSDFENSDAARNAIYNLDSQQVMSDLDTAFEYAKSIDAGTGEVSVIGFCWGGSQSFKYATHNSDLEEALVFYGTAPKDMEELAKIEIPVYGFYGGNDARVNSTIPETEDKMNKLGKFYSYNIYEGGGHGFMRSGAQPDASEDNKEAREKAWKDLLKVLK
ncbi:dienelactone hydrolase family protein [Psychroflexus salinarum]|uniref:Dienelactone hydrolase family protein n=1 Tax=Psychroflexus salinarum TaxID=546024 RepID=A0ABW3GKQ3_9FLAO